VPSSLAARTAGGILKLEPTEANTLAVPSLATLQSWSVALQSLMPQLEKPLRGGALNDVIRQVDDALLIETLGLRKRDVRALEDARMMMFERRSARK
jgi:adenine-specific DNA-methyltransferase